MSATCPRCHGPSANAMVCDTCLSGFPTTRRHPRTTGEAFHDAEYASAIEPPADDGVHLVTFELVRIIVVAAIVGALAVVFL